MTHSHLSFPFAAFRRAVPKRTSTLSLTCLQEPLQVEVAEIRTGIGVEPTHQVSLLTTESC
jgi:hypothetical protein